MRVPVQPGTVESWRGYTRTVGGLCFIPIRRIVPQVNPLRYGRADRVLSLVAAIEENDTFTPILVNQFNVILDGHHRYLAALILNLDPVPCQRVMDPLAAHFGDVPPDPDEWGNSSGSLDSFEPPEGDA